MGEGTKEVEVSEDKRSKVGYWQEFIRQGRKAAERHWEDGASAYAEYEYRSGEGYPIYKHSADKLVSAIYGKDGKPRSKRRFGIEDPLAMTAALINDRLGEHLMEHGSFYDAMCAATYDVVHASKGTTQVLYSADTETYRVPLSRGADGEGYYAEDGTPYTGEGVLNDESGEYYEEQRPKAGTKRVRLAPVLFDEIIHTPEAKTDDEIMEVGYKFCLSKEEAEELFNSDKKKTLPYKTIKTKDDDNKHEHGGEDEDQRESEKEVLVGWECYCKHSRKIYWVSPDFNDFLKVKDDEYSLVRFFPSPKFAVINKRRKSLYPTVAWVYLKPTANQLSELYERNFNLIKAIERKAVVYGASPELIAALNAPGGTYISAGKMMDILEKGGLDQLIQFIPVRELVESLRETIMLEEHFKNNFYEFYHMPDILRAQVSVEKTATESQIAQDEAHDTFRTIRERIIQLARDSLEMMLDLAYKVYSDDEIAEIVGYEFLPMGTPGVPAQPPSEQNPQGTPAVPPVPGHKERFYAALQLLKNDRQRLIRIDFETDSTSFRKDSKEIQKAQIISTTLTQGLGFIQSIQNPQWVPVAMNMLLNTLEAIGGDTKMEDMVRRAQKEIEDAKKNPPPPPPDYEQMKIQMKGQEMQMKMQNEAQKTQIKGMEVQLDAKDSEQRNQIASAMAQIRALEVNAKIEMEKIKEAFNQQLETALVQLEQQRVEIERYSALLSAQESLLEEVRLRQESDSAQVTQAIEMSKADEPKSPAPVTVNLIPDGVKAKKKRVIPIRDEQGSIVAADIEEIELPVGGDDGN